MDGLLSVADAASLLGRSQRRVRAMIADGIIPAQRVLGRWAVPADAVAGFAPRAGGRPLSQRSAWVVLGQLASGTSAKPIPGRLRARIHSLPDAPDPERTLWSWTASRGERRWVWISPSSMDSLAGDARVLIGGSGAVRDLEPAAVLSVYVGAGDVDGVVRDHGMQRARASHSVPNAVLWVVDDLTAVPRSPIDGRRVAAPVAAVDLIDSGDPDAVRIGGQILTSAVGALAAAAAAAVSVPMRTAYADRRPYVAVDDMETLRGPTGSAVELPLELNWGPQRTYDVSCDSDRRALYERVLNEAQHPEHLQQYLNGELLVQVWPQLFLPSQVRTLWEGKFPQLVSQPHAAAAAV